VPKPTRRRQAVLAQPSNARCRASASAGKPRCTHICRTTAIPAGSATTARWTPCTCGDRRQTVAHRGWRRHRSASPPPPQALESATPSSGPGRSQTANTDCAPVSSCTADPSLLGACKVSAEPARASAAATRGPGPMAGPARSARPGTAHAFHGQSPAPAPARVACGQLIRRRWRGRPSSPLASRGRPSVGGKAAMARPAPRTAEDGSSACGPRPRRVGVCGGDSVARDFGTPLRWPIAALRQTLQRAQARC